MIARTLPFHNGAVTQTRMVLPAHWASYLINGDNMIFDVYPEDKPALEAVKEFGHCVDCSEESAFVWNHDASADGVRPCQCLTYTFVKNEYTH